MQWHGFRVQTVKNNRRAPAVKLQPLPVIDRRLRRNAIACLAASQAALSAALRFVKHLASALRQGSRALISISSYRTVTAKNVACPAQPALELCR